MQESFTQILSFHMKKQKSSTFFMKIVPLHFSTIKSFQMCFHAKKKNKKVLQICREVIAISFFSFRARGSSPESKTDAEKLNICSRTDRKPPNFKPHEKVSALFHKILRTLHFLSFESLLSHFAISLPSFA